MEGVRTCHAQDHQNPPSPMVQERPGRVGVLDVGQAVVDQQPGAHFQGPDLQVQGPPLERAQGPVELGEELCERGVWKQKMEY